MIPLTKLAGPLAAAFGVAYALYEAQHSFHFLRSGPVYIPSTFKNTKWLAAESHLRLNKVRSDPLLSSPHTWLPQVTTGSLVFSRIIVPCS
jgi:hypothetical protein